MVAATGAFSEVADIDAASATPTVESLSHYGAVLYFSDNDPLDTVALGNVLADYFESGGAVVLAYGANATWHLGGRFQADYGLIDWGGDEVLFDRLGVVPMPSSPLMKDVRSLAARKAYRSTGRLVNGGTAIALWSIGERPLVAVGRFGDRNVVSLNLYPVPSTAEADLIDGDLAALVRNALVFR